MRIESGEKEFDNLKVCGALLVWAAFVGCRCDGIAEVALTPASSKEADHVQRTWLHLWL